MTGLYRDSGLDVYERSHYSQGEHISEVKQILSWYKAENTHVLDIGCSGGLHALEFAKQGFFVSGVDIEASAIELARKRNANEHKMDFMVIDIEKDELPPGRFNLIYSIGNVLSHVRKDKLVSVLKKIRERLDDDGIFLFDVLMKGNPFQEFIRRGDNQIIWERKIDEKTGKITMDGTFPEFGYRQHFEVWGYTVPEVRKVLNMSGFKEMEFSEKLDFKIRNKAGNPVSLNFRTRR